MIYKLRDIMLRPLEPEDLDALYHQKNDPDVAKFMGGFSSGYARSDLKEWYEYHRGLKNEVMWAIISCEKQLCIGHVGLYQIDFRVGKADFGIMIGDKAFWRRGIGEVCSRFAVEYGFRELNLNRIELTVLNSNIRAIRLYQKIGFKEEGRLRQAQYKDGKYHDVIIMAVLREEYVAGCAVTS